MHMIESFTNLWTPVAHVHFRIIQYVIPEPSLHKMLFTSSFRWSSFFRDVKDILRLANETSDDVGYSI